MTAVTGRIDRGDVPGDDSEEPAMGGGNPYPDGDPVEQGERSHGQQAPGDDEEERHRPE